MSINFHHLSTPFHVEQKNKLKKWIRFISSKNEKKCGDINYIFQTDDELLHLNKTHLQHDYYTDIITFNYSEGKILHGDLNISVDRIRDNAHKFAVPFEEELHRVMIHGILHLIGFNDKTKTQQEEMRKQEDESLQILKTESFT